MGNLYLSFTLIFIFDHEPDYPESNETKKYRALRTKLFSQRVTRSAYLP